jgi:hypothetical protein
VGFGCGCGLAGDPWGSAAAQGVGRRDEFLVTPYGTVYMPNLLLVQVPVWYATLYVHTPIGLLNVQFYAHIWLMHRLPPPPLLVVCT